MKKNILSENMRRFGTKNLNEQYSPEIEKMRQSKEKMRQSKSDIEKEKEKKNKSDQKMIPMKRGEKSSRVAALQLLLQMPLDIRKEGAEIQNGKIVKGRFGPKTEHAVKSFQNFLKDFDKYATRDIEVTGQVDGPTWQIIVFYTPIDKHLGWSAKQLDYDSVTK